MARGKFFRGAAGAAGKGKKRFPLEGSSEPRRRNREPALPVRSGSGKRFHVVWPRNALLSMPKETVFYRFFTLSKVVSTCCTSSSESRETFFRGLLHMKAENLPGVIRRINRASQSEDIPPRGIQKSAGHFKISHTAPFPLEVPVRGRD